MLSTDTTQPLYVEENAQFYCLIGRFTGLDAHTFFHMGYINADGQAMPLLEVGKMFDFGLQYQDQGFKAVSNALFSKTGAMIHCENRLLRKQCSNTKSFDISYSAYDITREQYLYFLGVLKDINTQQKTRIDSAFKNIFLTQVHSGMAPMIDSSQFYKKYLPKGAIYAYQPSGKDGMFLYKSINDWNASVQNIKANFQASFLSLNNTCRHTGLDFLLLALGASSFDYPPQVSPQFIFPLPCKTTLLGGKYLIPLYLLPLPPSAYSLDRQQNRIASIIYYRMETLLQANINHANTRQKFNLLKSVYQTTLAEKTPALNFLQIVVRHYQNPKNKDIVNQHRGWHWPFFHSPKTQQMFEQFESEYEKLAVRCQ